MNVPIILALSLFLGADAGALEPKDSVSFVGEFSNMRFTEEHQYGSSVRLWQAGDSLVGHFLHSEGLAGDTPLGVLEEVSFNRKSGDLSFKAKLTMGQHFCKEHSGGVPSRDLFAFSGRLEKNRMTGTISIADPLHGSEGAEATNVVLKREADRSSNHFGATYGEWRAKTKELLGFRGPKW